MFSYHENGNIFWKGIMKEGKQEGEWQQYLKMESYT